MRGEERKTIWQFLFERRRYIQINFMDFDSLRKILARANLGLSPDMVGKVWDFLENHIGRTSEDMQEDAFAALGIVSEV